MFDYKIDCHTHDLRSDGHNNIQEFANEAEKLGMNMVASTNHDIIDRDLKKILNNTNIIVPEAVEISAQNYDINKSLHLTCYSNNFKLEVDDVLKNTLNGKKIMLEKQVKKMKNMGFSIEMKDVEEFNLAKGKKLESLNKFSIAEYICNGKNKNINNLFILEKFGNNYDHIWLFFNLLKKGGEYFENYSVKVNDYEPDIEIVGELARNSNAILSIAHPNFTFKKGISEFEKGIEYYIDRGVNAVEVNPKANKEWIESIIKIRKKYNLILTFGSDCHKIGYIDDKHDDFGIINKCIDQERIKENFYRFIEKIEI